MPGLFVLAALALAARAAVPAGTVQIPSSVDGRMQPALLHFPENISRPVPLLVHLHTWSARYNASSNIEEAFEEASKRGWVILSPDFRGVNDHPEACASRLASSSMRWPSPGRGRRAIRGESSCLEALAAGT